MPHFRHVTGQKEEIQKGWTFINLKRKEEYKTFHLNHEYYGGIFQKTRGPLGSDFLLAVLLALDFVLRALWALRPCDPHILNADWISPKTEEKNTRFCAFLGISQNQVVLTPADLVQLFLFPRYCHPYFFVTEQQYVVGIVGGIGDFFDLKPGKS